MGSRDFEWEKIPVSKDVRPPPRWRHSANLVETKIVVFGGFHSTMERFNDVWVGLISIHLNHYIYTCVYYGQTQIHFLWPS